MTNTQRDDETLADVLLFASGDDNRASPAFERLNPQMRRFLARRLARSLAVEADREDVISATLAKLWERRKSFQSRTIYKWWCYVSLTARSCLVDHVRKNPGSEDLDWDPPEKDQPYIEALLNLIDLQMVFDAADEFWLHVPEGTSLHEKRRRLLAVQLFYLHGRSWEQVCKLVGPPRLSRQVLDEWLLAQWTVLLLTFAEVCLPSEKLLGVVLQPEKPLHVADVRRLLEGCYGQESEPSACEWTRDEIRIAARYIVNGLTTDKIKQMETGLAPEFVDDIVVRCREGMPFAAIARALMRRLSSALPGAAPLKERDLWKRCVFQYRISCDLPHKQILERLQPAAEIGGYPTLNEKVLNAWLSNGRLYTHLAAYVTGRNDAP